MTGAVIKTGRFVALWLAMMTGTIISGLALHLTPRAGVADGPLSASGAMLVVTALGALVVGGIASRLAAGTARRFGLLAIIVFTLETGLSSIESAVFHRSLGLSSDDLWAIAGAGLARSLVSAVAAALLWRGKAHGDVPRIKSERARIAAVVAVYVALYLVAGMFAWRSEAVRSFYGNGLDIRMPALIALQIGRGAVWCALAMLLVTNMRGDRLVIAAYIAAAFAVLMAAPLLYPSAIMPWVVRRVHLVELAMSNATFGLMAVLLLRDSGKASIEARLGRV